MKIVFTVAEVKRKAAFFAGQVGMIDDVFRFDNKINRSRSEAEGDGEADGEGFHGISSGFGGFTFSIMFARCSASKRKSEKVVYSLGRFGHGVKFVSVPMLSDSENVRFSHAIGGGIGTHRS